MNETASNGGETIAAFADSARDFLRAESPLSRLRNLRDTSPGFERETWHRLAEAGWAAILVPESCDGLGLDLSAAAAIAREVGQSPLPEPFIGGCVHSAALLNQVPESDLRDRLLRDLASGSLVIGVAWQEEVGQFDQGTPTTDVQRSGDSITLKGQKQGVVPGLGADGWLVSGSLNGTCALVWVPAGTANVQISTQIRVDGSLVTTLDFDGASVPTSHLLHVGDNAAANVDAANNAARFVSGAELVGLATRALDITLEYLKTRTQFGKPIGANQALKHRMVDAYLETTLASAALDEGWRSYRQGECDLSLLASRVKARCISAAMHVTRLAIQLHGAIGFTDECDIGLYFKRALTLATWLGNEESCSQKFISLQLAAEPVVPASKSPTVEVRGDANWNSMSEEQFRAMVREFISKNYPQALRYPSRRLHWAEIKDWYLALSRQGWIAPAWPREFGGMALPADKLLAYHEEMERYGVARTPDQGIINLGPILIRFGTDEQKARYLPRILAGEDIWCQGYSEPNAGSDLASLSTEAVADGDAFVVNGQKIWTTLAQDADHIFMLVRTDKTGKKQAGISFLLVDLKTPGVTVRPIRNIAGEEEFCEVFFDNVRVPRENLVGELNKGWQIAKDLLGFERIFIGSPQQSQYAMSLLNSLADARGLYEDAAFMSRYARLRLDLEDLSAMYAHFAEIVKKGGMLPPSVSLLKIWATETYSRIAIELVESAAELGAVPAESVIGNARISYPAPLMHSMVTTIYAGTNEIQRNIVAKHVLHLPD